MDRFDAQVARIIGRRRRVDWWNAVQRTAFFTFAGVVAVALLDRVLFETGLKSGLISHPVVVSTLLGAVAVFVPILAWCTMRRPDAPRVLAELDRRVEAQELISTAFSTPSEERFAPTLRRLASERIDSIRLEDVFPAPLTGYVAMLVLVLLSGGVLLAVPGSDLKPPAAALEAVPVRGPAPLPVEFRNGSSGHISRYEWDFGDGSPPVAGFRDIAPPVMALLRGVWVVGPGCRRRR